MTVCERCGSVRVFQDNLGLLDQVLALLGNRRPFTCRRCGWRGRRNWPARTDSQEIPGPSAHPELRDPDMVVLDLPPGSRTRAWTAHDRAVSEFERLELETPDAAAGATADVKTNRRPDGRVRRRRRKHRLDRRGRFQRQEVYTAIALSLLATSLVALIVLLRSCAPPQDF